MKSKLVQYNTKSVHGRRDHSSTVKACGQRTGLNRSGEEERRGAKLSLSLIVLCFSALSTLSTVSLRLAVSLEARVNPGARIVSPFPDPRGRQRAQGVTDWISSIRLWKVEWVD